MKSPNVKYIEKNYHGVERFFYHQKNIYSFQKELKNSYKCFFVSFEEFVFSYNYRENLFLKVFEKDIKQEVNRRFIPEWSLKNIKPVDNAFYSLSANVDLRGLEEKFDQMEGL